MIRWHPLLRQASTRTFTNNFIFRLCRDDLSNVASGFDQDGSFLPQSQRVRRGPERAFSPAPRLVLPATPPFRDARGRTPACPKDERCRQWNGVRE